MQYCDFVTILLSMSLNAKQLRFAQEYAVSSNATQAAIAAGYAERTARQVGSRLLSHVDVAAEIQRLQVKTAKKLEVTAERVIEEIAHMAFYDPAEFLVDSDDFEEVEGSNGKTFLTSGEHIKQLPESVRRAITGWKWDKAGNLVIQLADKSKALDQLARHLSLYNDKIDVTVNDQAERLRRGRERVAKQKGANE